MQRPRVRIPCGCAGFARAIPRKVFVVGVGMSKFGKPAKDPEQGPHYPELVEIAVHRALNDACLSVRDIEARAYPELGSTSREHIASSRVL